MLFLLNIDSIFKKTDLFIGSSGRKFLKVGAMPTENLPVKSFKSQSSLNDAQLLNIRYQSLLSIENSDVSGNQLKSTFWEKMEVIAIFLFMLTKYVMKFCCDKYFLTLCHYKKWHPLQL